jgi:ubiquinone/menaquinone biosynthesis C-methylase UbiE
MDEQEKRRHFIQRTFNQVAPEYGKGSCRFFHISGELMAGMLGLQGHESVLDVAAGTGATSLPLARYLSSGRVMAIDFSSAMLDQARKLAADAGLMNITFAQGDMTRLPFATDSFDHVTCAFGLFFVDDMTATLAHLARHVKPGGRVLISGFRGDSFQPMAGLLLDRLRDWSVAIPERIGWQRMAEPEQLQDLFTAAGFDTHTIVRRSLGYRISLDDWWNIVWSAGFRGFVEQLGQRVDEFKQAHFEELRPLMTADRLWLEIDVNFSCAFRPS